MKVGVATIYYKSVPLVSAVELLSRITDNIMISPIYSQVTEEDLQNLNYIKDTLGIEYYIHGLFPASGTDPYTTGYNIRDIKETINNAYKLESDIVILHPTPKKLYESSVNILKEALKFAEDRGVKLAIENKPEDDVFLKSEEDFSRLIEDIPEIKLCLDTSHFFLWNGDSERLSQVIKEFKDYIAIFHIADARVGEDLQMLPGYGDINWYLVGRSLINLDLRKVPLILESIYPTNVLEGIKNLRQVIVDHIW